MKTILALLMLGFIAWGSGYNGFGSFHAYGYPSYAMVYPTHSYYSVNVASPIMPVFYAPRNSWAFNVGQGYMGNSMVYSRGSYPAVRFIDP